MLSTIKEILLDFQEVKQDTGTPRRLHIQSVKGKATVLIGVRRAGKSTCLFQKVASLLQKGVSIHSILYINFFDDRLYGLQKLELILEAYYSIYPEKKHKETVYYFFDEIQVVPGWEPFVDRIMRTENCEIYISGSSAQMLSKEIATQMRGRALSWEVFPFSFQEFLDYKGITIESSLSSSQRLLVQNGFDRFWETGGFPEVLGLDRAVRIKIHQEYFHSILFRDLIERHDTAHPKAIIDVAHWLINNIGSLYSINNITGHLKSLGHKISKVHVSEYLTWFEDAYFLFTVRVFDASVSRSLNHSKKIYCIDSSLVTSVASGILINSGHLLENLIFSELRRLTPHIFYFKTHSGKEVDFIIQQQEKPRVLIQVSESLADPKTKKREVAALAEAMKELGLGIGWIVTRDEEETFTTEAGTIRVVQAWRFLISLKDF